MKKIVFVIPSLSGGGSERVVSVLANKFADIGYNVTVICLLKQEHTYYTNEKVNVIFIQSNTKLRLKRNIEKFIKYVNVLRRINPDVVISFTYDCSMITAIATRFIRTKLIISERNDPNNDPSSEILRKLRNILYKFGDGFVFQTTDAKEYYNKLIRSKSAIIGNPLNENIPSPYRGKRENRIVCVSRLAPQKNIPLLIKSFSKVKDKLSDYIVEIYGDGPSIDEIKKCIKENKLEDKVILKGYSTNVYRDIYNAEIFVIPSNYEGVSNSMLEAMALGIPVIATDCPIGGARTYIKNYHNGILVSVGDVNEMSMALLNLANNNDLKSNISRESIKVKDILNSDFITKQWIEFIDSVECKNEL